MHRQYGFFLPLLACLMVSACGEGSIGKRLGMERQVPDEFQVLSRPPLHIPPEFNLEPPGEGEDGGGLVAPASRQAEETVFGATDSSSLGYGNADTAVMPVTSSDAASQTDQNFLNRAGATEADPDIRKTLREENGQTGYEEEKSILEELRETTKGEPTVDAKKEAERIKENLDEGKAINEGDVEIKEPKNRGILDKLDGVF